MTHRASLTDDDSDGQDRIVGMMIFICEFIRNQNLSVAILIQFIAVQVAAFSGLAILMQIVVWQLTH